MFMTFIAVGRYGWRYVHTTTVNGILLMWQRNVRTTFQTKKRKRIPKKEENHSTKDNDDGNF